MIKRKLLKEFVLTKSINTHGSHTIKEENVFPRPVFLIYFEFTSLQNCLSDLGIHMLKTVNKNRTVKLT